MDLGGTAPRRGWICILLVGLTVGVFWPVLNCEFTNFDDPYYVTANPRVLGGLTLGNVGWAFGAGYYANWHPLTWLSHMADMELFGRNAWGHHLTSLVLHTSNVLLVFWVLRRMTGATWRSATVAALFAVHPVHVESVAWIAERKDVLSTFFFLLTLSTYTRYAESRRLEPDGRIVEGRASQDGLQSPVPSAPSLVRGPWPYLHHPSSISYLLSLLCLALGLMSKPMLVTTPFVLLLLDYWPLRRFEWNRQEVGFARRHFTLVWEKAPFFLLSAVASVVTFVVQRAGGATLLLGHISLANRLGNAAISYLRYIGKMFWPSQLAVLYPYPIGWPAWQVAGAVVVLLGLSLAAIRLARRHPYAPVGWFWYLGTLVPVIGVIQVGEQAIADRYTYIPMIGLLIWLTWGIWEVAGHWPQRHWILGGVTVVILGLLAVGTRAQLRYWRTGRALLEHSLQAGGPSAVILGNLGAIAAEEGHLDEAERRFAEAVRLQPTYVRAKLGLVMALAHEGKLEEASLAIGEMAPEWEAEARRQIGEKFLESAKTSEAIEQFSAAAKLDSTNAPIRERLGLLLAQAGKGVEASEQFKVLVRLRPDAPAHYYLGLSLLTIGKPEEAAEQYREALLLRPDWPEALNDLAWLLATASRQELRQPAEAVRLAERACELSGRREARFLGTLDAAYAAAGRFPEAIAGAQETHRVAQAAGDQSVADAANERLGLYRNGRPYYQPTP